MSENEEVYEKPSIIVISDFVCPWCYIGLSEVERLSKEYDKSSLRRSSCGRTRLRRG